MSIAEKIIFVFFLQGVCCRDYDISLPVKIQALSGSCVIIKCTFEFKDIHDKDLTESDAAGVWLKDGTRANINRKFNSKVLHLNYFSGKITGKLHEKNCTTVFYNVSSNHNGDYYFRIESGPFMYTYTQHMSTINVIDSPHKPTVQLYAGQKEVQDQEEVLEWRYVSLHCSAETLCSSPPPTLTWSSTPTFPFSESSRLQELELISDLNFTATHHHHGVTFTCTITYQLQDKNKTAQNSITLYVQYSPKDTSVSVSPSSSVLEGSSVTLICSSDANPAVVSYTWSRESVGQLKQLQTGDTLTFSRAELKHRGWYHCTAQNQHGSQNSSVMLDIQYSPQISNSSNCIRAVAPVCFCEADGNPSPQLEWHLSGHPVTNSSNTFISEERKNSTSLKSSITLHQSLTNPSTLQCVSKNTHGNASQRFLLDFIIQKAPCKWFNMYSLLVGVAVGTLFMAILWVTVKCVSRTQRGDEAGLIQNDAADLVDRREEPFYGNKVMMQSAEDPTLNHSEHLHYATITFINTKPKSDDNRGISSLTTDYAVIKYCGRNVEDGEAKIRNLSPMTDGEAIYQVPHKVAAR